MSRTRQRKTADELLPQSLTAEIMEALPGILEPGVFRHEYLLSQVFTKFVGPTTASAEERRSAAVEKWLTTEVRNQKTNARLASRAMARFYPIANCNKTMDAVLDRARQLIETVIGPEPSLDPHHGGFSGGATTSRRRKEGHPAFKYLEKADVTRSAYPLFFDMIRGTSWKRSIDRRGLDIRIVPGNVLFTVPKSSVIDRVAAKEPDLNVFMQKCFGNQIRWALRRVGIDLNDQSVNAELARKGSLTGELATLDLSSASDSVSCQLVRRLLPSSWYMYLDLVRSPVTLIDGKEHLNEMFSSMGNGFTFELESLIFWALARSVAYLSGSRGRISVYGDDIIVPTVMVEDLVRVLSFAGFSVNEQKSFASGPFRESCGAHWYNGTCVKPFYLRRPITRQSDLILFLNALTRWGAELRGSIRVRRGPRHYVWELPSRIRAFFEKYAAYIPQKLWGGQDFTSRSSLVTGHRPRKELVAVTQPISLPDEGKYLNWLLTNHARQGIPEDGSDSRDCVYTGLYRLRRNLQSESDDVFSFC